MINDLIENLKVDAWEFTLQTINACTIQNKGLNLHGEIAYLEQDDIYQSGFIKTDVNNILVKSTLNVDQDKWNIIVFKQPDCMYYSVATLSVNSGTLALQIVSENTAQFSKAQRELACILKKLDINKIRINEFTIGNHTFQSDVWRHQNGKLFCPDGVCNVATDRSVASTIVSLSKKYKLVSKDDDIKYYAFNTSNQIVQLLQVDNLLFYAICNHDVPLYKEIKEV